MRPYFASFIILANYILRILDFAKNDFDHWINSGVFCSRAHTQSDITSAKNLIRLILFSEPFVEMFVNLIVVPKK